MKLKQVLLVTMLLLGLSCYALDKPCNEKCLEDCFKKCASGGSQLNALKKIYGEGVENYATNNSEDAFVLCTIAYYYGNISKEDYAPYVVKVLGYFMKYEKDLEFESLLEKLVIHIEEPNIPNNEYMIRYTIAGYNAKYKQKMFKWN